MGTRTHRTGLGRTDTPLGYTRYVAQGGDWGAPSPARWRDRRLQDCSAFTSTCRRLCRPRSQRCSPPARLLRRISPPEERAAFDALSIFYKKYRAYAAMMGTRPQTIGYALTDSRAGLAAWMLDYNNAEPLRLLTRDEMLDDVTLYWLTNTATSSARIYWETSGQSVILPPRRRQPKSRFPSRSPSSRTKCIALQRAGPAALIATSATSTRSTRADTSQPGNSPNFSPGVAAAFRPLRRH